MYTECVILTFDFAQGIQVQGRLPSVRVFLNEPNPYLHNEEQGSKKKTGNLRKMKPTGVIGFEPSISGLPAFESRTTQPLAGIYPEGFSLIVIKATSDQCLTNPHNHPYPCTSVRKQNYSFIFTIIINKGILFPISKH